MIEKKLEKLTNKELWDLYHEFHQKTIMEPELKKQPVSPIGKTLYLHWAANTIFWSVCRELADRGISTTNA